MVTEIIHKLRHDYCLWCTIFINSEFCVRMVIGQSILLYVRSRSIYIKGNIYQHIISSDAFNLFRYILFDIWWNLVRNLYNFICAHVNISICILYVCYYVSMSSSLVVSILFLDSRAVGSLYYVPLQRTHGYQELLDIIL